MMPLRGSSQNVRDIVGRDWSRKKPSVTLASIPEAKALSSQSVPETLADQDPNQSSQKETDTCAMTPTPRARWTGNT